MPNEANSTEVGRGRPTYEEPAAAQVGGTNEANSGGVAYRVKPSIRRRVLVTAVRAGDRGAA